MSNLGNCIIGRLDRKLCKYIYNLLHCENITVQQIMKCKLLSSTSIFADNYRYLCNKYNIAHSDWYRDMPFITNMICTEYTNHQYDISKTVIELCELRDDVAHCGVVNRTDICSLLEVLCTDKFSLISLFILFIYFYSIIIFSYILFVYNCIFCVLLCKKYVRIKIYI